FDVALYRMDVDGRLVSSQNKLGREFFQNAGENTHTGIEIGLQWFPRPEYELALTYTGTKYEFQEKALEGKLLPGVPEHRLYTSIQAEAGGLWGRAELEAVSEYFVDDANTDVNEGYYVIDIQIGHEGFRFRDFQLRPFAALRNVFDEVYSASVVVNAAAGRYYEPSPGRALLVGVQASI
ncbi:MAG: TonB-dependent receptor, partial [Rhodothermales bacterium]